MATPKLIVPDEEIARIAVEFWPNPVSDYYQARVMTTIALMESNGDTYALLMNAEPSVLAGYLDRGLWGINEGALHGVIKTWVDPRTFINPHDNGQYARNIWDWRYDTKLATTHSVGNALVYAYEGWTTYRKARTEKEPAYVTAWGVRWARASNAVAAVTS